MFIAGYVRFQLIPALSRPKLRTRIVETSKTKCSSETAQDTASRAEESAIFPSGSWEEGEDGRVRQRELETQWARERESEKGSLVSPTRPGVHTVPPHSTPEQRQKRFVLPEGWWAWSSSDFRASKSVSPFLLVILRSWFKLWVTILKGMLLHIQIRIWNIALKITKSLPTKACYPSHISKYRKRSLLCFHRHRRGKTENTVCKIQQPSLLFDLGFSKTGSHYEALAVLELTP